MYESYYIRLRCRAAKTFVPVRDRMHMPNVGRVVPYALLFVTFGDRKGREHDARGLFIWTSGRSLAGVLFVKFCDI